LTQKKGTGPVPLSLQLEELVAFQEVNDTGRGNPWQSNHRKKLRPTGSIEFPLAAGGRFEKPAAMLP
jgi:hypothetical protein